MPEPKHKGNLRRGLKLRNNFSTRPRSLTGRKKMNVGIDWIAVGARFKLSKLGITRCPDLAGKIGGVVVMVSARTTGITVLFDGARRPTVLHRDYISPATERIGGDGSLRYSAHP